MLYPQMNESRNLYSLDGGWEFYKDESDVNFDDVAFIDLSQKDTRAIAVPASWNDQYEDLFQFHGKGWYQKKICLSNQWKGEEIYIRFGSVSSKAKVWINGAFVTEHIGTALPFEAKITQHIRVGEENIITVLADNTLDPWALPPASLKMNEGHAGFENSYPAVTYDFFPFGGIHRSVYLYSTPSVRIEDVTIKTKISGEVSCKIELSDSFSGCVSLLVEGRRKDINCSGEKVIRGDITVENPRLWDIGKPNLYDMVISIKNDDVYDTYTQKFGIREVEIKNNKLCLNGREVFLKGFGKHEDFHVIGKGYCHAVTVKDFDLLKWIGANSFRTSHYPYDENILDMADREGILVISETPFVGLDARNYTDEILAKALSVIEELIKRDKNHPSVVMWSLANEPIIETEAGECFFKAMAETARALDSTRPVTYVAFRGLDNNRGLENYDIVCINRYYSWYEYPGQLDIGVQELIKSCDSFYQKYKKGVILTEFGADAVAGMHTNPPQMFSEEFQSEMIRMQYEAFSKLPYAAGTHVWAFADFKTAQTPMRIVFNRKGVFTREREPKMSAHTLRKLWRKEEV